MTIDFQAIKDIVLITVPIITAYLTYRSNKKSKKELNDELEVRLREQDNETASPVAGPIFPRGKSPRRCWHG